MTSYALATESVFPFVTFPHFVFRGASNRIAGDTVMTFYMPYITEDLKVPWETYALANRGYYRNASKSEEESKVAQDKLFGKKTPKLTGDALELLKSVEETTAAGGFDFSKIWFSGAHKNMTIVSSRRWSQEPGRNRYLRFAHQSFLLSLGGSLLPSLAHNPTYSYRYPQRRHRAVRFLEWRCAYLSEDRGNRLWHDDRFDEKRRRCNC